jgi:hypothetical protein
MGEWGADRRDPQGSPRRPRYCVACHQLPGRFDPVEHGHADVHEDDVRAPLAADPDGLLAVRCGAANLEVVLCLEQRGEARTHDLLVVDDDDADRHRAAPIGSSAWTAKPPASPGPALSVPPTISARSRIPSNPSPSGSAADAPGPSSLTRSVRLSPA